MDEQRQLIRRTLTGEADMDEMEALSKRPVVEHRMKAQWEEGGKTPAGAEEDEAEEEISTRIWQHIQARLQLQGGRGRTRGRSLRRRLFAAVTTVAACVALVIGAVAWLTSGGEAEQSPAVRWAQATSGAIGRAILLPDSTRVWLRPHSRLDYRAEAFTADRRVWLQGEAIFDVVRRDAAHPFRVQMDSSCIEVKGTAFRAVNRPDLPREVDLFRGQVHFHAAGRTVPMQPHQHLCFTPGTNRVEVSEAVQVEWQNGRFRFADMTTADLMATIGHIYGARIVLSDKLARDEKFNGSLRVDESLDDVLRKVCYNLGASYSLCADGSYLIK